MLLGLIGGAGFVEARFRGIAAELLQKRHFDSLTDCHDLGDFVSTLVSFTDDLAEDKVESPFELYLRRSERLASVVLSLSNDAASLDPLCNQLFEWILRGYAIDNLFSVASLFEDPQGVPSRREEIEEGHCHALGRFPQLATMALAASSAKEFFEMVKVAAALEDTSSMVAFIANLLSSSEEIDKNGAKAEYLRDFIGWTKINLSFEDAEMVAEILGLELELLEEATDERTKQYELILEGEGYENGNKFQLLNKRVHERACERALSTPFAYAAYLAWVRLAEAENKKLWSMAEMLALKQPLRRTVRRSQPRMPPIRVSQ